MRAAEEAERLAAEEQRLRAEEAERLAAEEQRRLDEERAAAEDQRLRLEEDERARAEREERERIEAIAEERRRQLQDRAGENAGADRDPPQLRDNAGPIDVITEDPVAADGAADDATAGDTAPPADDIIATPARTLEEADAEVAAAEEALAEARRTGGNVPAARARLRAARFDRRVLREQLAAETAPPDDGSATAETVETVDDQSVTVVADEMSEDERRRIAAEDELRRERRRRRRAELIGAAAAGVAVGAIIPQLGGRVVEDGGDRIVVQQGDTFFIRRDENELLRDRAENFEIVDLGGGLTETRFFYEDGTEVLTVRDAGGGVLRRSRILPDGEEIVLFDDTPFPDAPAREETFVPPPPVEVRVVDASRASDVVIGRALAPETVVPLQRTYSLRDVRRSESVRDRVQRIDLDSITFDTGSAAVRRSQLPFLDEIGLAMAAVVDEDPASVFLIEGHTDAIGSDASNILLSDRRAETVAALMADRYGIPAENLIVEGYGEQFLKVETAASERANRRVTVRNITPLLTARGE